MNTVPTTETLIDAQRFHKELQEKNTLLRVENERLEQQYQLTLFNIQDIRREQEQVHEKINYAIQSAFGIIKEINHAIDLALSVIRSANSEAERSLLVVGKLHDEVDALKAQLEVNILANEKIHSAVVAEERELLRKQHSLGIYEKRLNDRIIEAGLEKEIKVIL